MTDKRKFNETEFLTEFITVYKSFPCLWKIKSKEYSDKNLKQKGYEALVNVCRTYDEAADVQVVKKKISCLRAAFRREFKKQQGIKHSGVGAEESEEYVPSLWYFNLLLFILDQERPRTTISNDGGNDDNDLRETCVSNAQQRTQPGWPTAFAEGKHCEGVLTNKRTKTGRMQEVSHEAGESCHCKRLKCYENITESERKQLLSRFNGMSDNNEQNAYLCSLISLVVIQRRRNRNPEEEAAYHDSTYFCIVRIKRDGNVLEIPVCIHGVTKGKVEYLQKSLKETGKTDKRGKHCALTNKLPNDSYKKVYDHINSFNTFAT
ncbi:hypothetical protein FQR65_LT17135 [Abscondita terminalis]|nr:hypothetical protein FQR65_LT17135 [Abscondita terminalis]